jgi:type II secretory pathway pseudopilin PulG
MIAVLRQRLGKAEAGMTLIELLVAAAMGVVLMGGVVTLLIGGLRSQPKLSQKNTNIQTARVVLERMTRELRNGIVVKEAKTTTVSFETYVRSSACGAKTGLAATSPSIKCQVRYTCEAGSCKRTETAPGTLTGGTPVTMVTGLGSGTGFSYSPSTVAPTYVKANLVIPSPGGGTDATTISDGASLRNATLSN